MATDGNSGRGSRRSQRKSYGVHAAGFIGEQIKQRKCSTFIPDPKNSNACQCGRNADWHQAGGPGDQVDSGQPWDSDRHTVLEACDSFGDIRFIGYGSQSREAPYVRVECDTKMDTVWKLLTDEKLWQLPLPKLLISVTGGAKRYRMQPRLENILKRGLVNTAVSTKAWVITGGTATGVMKLVGETVDENTQATGNPDKRIFAIGIAAWGFIANNQVLKAVKDDLQTVDYNLKEANDDKKKSAPLDHNHTHFLLVDDGTMGRPGADIKFRSELENYVSSARWAENRSDETRVPCVLIVVEGGVNTLETVWESIKRNSCVIVIAQSGRAADFISLAYNITKPQGDGSSFPADFDDRMSAKARKLLGEDPNIVSRALQRIKDCLAKRYLLNIFDPDRMNSAFDIEQTVLHALLKNASTENGSLDQCACQRLLSLALAWKRCDFARERIFTSNNRRFWQNADLHSAMSTALQDDQVDFVQLFLDFGIDLKHFLTKRTLCELYIEVCGMGSIVQSVDTGEMEELLNDIPMRKFSWETVRIDRDYDRLQHDINRVLTWLMLGKWFSFDAVEHFYCQADHCDYDMKVDSECINYDGLNSFNGENDCDAVGISCWEWNRQRENQNWKPDFEHPERDLFRWAILFNRQKLAELFWKACRDHLGGALCASALLKRLSKRAKQKEMAELADLLKQHSAVWESRAVEVLGECNRSDPELTDCLLVRDLPYWSPDAVAGESTLLNLIEAHGLINFAGHSACHKKISAIWMGRLALYTPLWKILLCIFLPVFVRLLKFNRECDRAPGGQSGSGQNHTATGSRLNRRPGTVQSPRSVGQSCSKGPDVCLARAVGFFYAAPVTKFYFNIISYIVYLGLFSYVMLVDLQESLTLTECMLWGWQVTQIVEGIRQNYFGLNIRYTRQWKLLDLWICCSCLNIIAVRFILPIIGLPFMVVRGLYSLILIGACTRFMQYFYAAKSIGPKVIMMEKMVMDVVLFLAILFAFALGFGVAYHALLYPNTQADTAILFNVLLYPYFQIYGDPLLDSLKGNGRGWCENNETVWLESDDPYLRCAEENPYLNILLAIYMILTNILLVNLLIAMFSHTLHNVQQNSLKVWRFYRLLLVLEYFDRPVLVPPFIVLNHVFLAVRHLCCRRRGSSKKYNPLRLTLDQNGQRRLTQFEKNATEKYLLQTSASFNGPGNQRS